MEIPLKNAFEPERFGFGDKGFYTIVTIGGLAGHGMFVRFLVNASCEIGQPKVVQFPPLAPLFQNRLPSWSESGSPTRNAPCARFKYGGSRCLVDLVNPVPSGAVTDTTGFGGTANGARGVNGFE